jgi:hypothetical protein
MKTYEQVLDEVIGAIDAYKGEEIVANEHPLHLAIQAMESRQRPRPLQKGRQSKLFQPACQLWFKGLKTSRGLTPESDPHGTGPKAAIAWMLLLKDELLRQDPGELREAWTRRAKHRIKAMAGKLPPIDEKYKPEIQAVDTGYVVFLRNGKTTVSSPKTDARHEFTTPGEAGNIIAGLQWRLDQLESR